MLNRFMKMFFIVIGTFLLAFNVNAVNINTKGFSGADREKLKQYYESGLYFKEIEHLLVEAKDYLDRQLSQERPNRLAIVLDVDETAISNYRGLERVDFTSNPSAITAIMMQANAEPILPVLQFYQHAISKGVTIFFISSRPNSPELMDVTSKNLKNAGYTTWEELILKPLNKDKQSIQEFKTNSRRHITALGYDIILNIGDQQADMEGGYAEARVRLPNPFYELS